MKMPVAKAVVKKLMPGQNKLNLDHGPIPELGWPSMVTRTPNEISTRSVAAPKTFVAWLEGKAYDLE